MCHLPASYMSEKLLRVYSDNLAFRLISIFVERRVVLLTGYVDIKKIAQSPRVCFSPVRMETGNKSVNS